MRSNDTAGLRGRREFLWGAATAVAGLSLTMCGGRDPDGAAADPEPLLVGGLPVRRSE